MSKKFIIVRISDMDFGFESDDFPIEVTFKINDVDSNEDIIKKIEFCWNESMVIPIPISYDVYCRCYETESSVHFVEKTISIRYGEMTDC